jgi:hypothetical protein
MKPSAGLGAPSEPCSLKKMLRGAGTLVAPQTMTPVAQLRHTGGEVHAVAGVHAVAPGSEPDIFAVPAWAVGLVGAIVVLSGVLYFFWRVRSARRAPRAPTSVRPATGKIR